MGFRVWSQLRRQGRGGCGSGSSKVTRAIGRVGRVLFDVCVFCLARLTMISAAGELLGGGGGLRVGGRGGGV